MTNQQHPITSLPKGLKAEWESKWHHYRGLDTYEEFMAKQAAQWGADQELEACCEWTQSYAECGDSLRAARRPKPPSLKEQALESLREAEASGHLYVNGRSDTIRRALEALPND